MATSIASPDQANLFDEVLAGLRTLGYRDELLQPVYRFEDWFGQGQRTADAAAFGQTPPSYRNACFAVLMANGKSGPELIRDYRSLGAPRAFEVRPDRVLHWRVNGDSAVSTQPLVIPANEVRAAFRANASLWGPESVLRLKNVGPVDPAHRDFIDLGLIPELEYRISAKLGPLLGDILFRAIEDFSARTGSDPDPDELFRLLFRALAGKVMHDRDRPGFEAFRGAPDADAVLHAVADYYRDQQPVLADPETRRLVVGRLWRSFSFKNLSVDVLAFVWEDMLADREARATLGIHTTPPSIARYIVRRLPIENIPYRQRRVVEPCCGSATFLLAAFQRLRELPPVQSMPPAESHRYLQRMLSGFDIETFGLEVARHCLMLADYPSRNGWVLEKEDVFQQPKRSPKFYGALAGARVVLCNPPFELFPKAVRQRYSLRSVLKPAELLGRVLDHLHPEGLLGFVLPYQALSGASYRSVRDRLAERYDEIEIVSLPGKDVFRHAEHETALLIATNPRRAGDRITIHHSKVPDGGWPLFNAAYVVGREDVSTKTTEAAAESLAVPPLTALWAYLHDAQRLESAAEVHRGIEWNLPLTIKRKETGNRDKLISSTPKKGFREGVPPRASIHAFERPETRYLSMRPEDQKGNAYKRQWDRPKVLLNAIRKSRGAWRLAAFADFDGLVCYQNLAAIWPNEPENTVALAAVLNGPIANAFVATREERHVPNETLEAIPIPSFTAEQRVELERLVSDYTRVSGFLPLFQPEAPAMADIILRQIDAIVLAAYNLPPRLERYLLDYFAGSERAVRFAFSPYFPADFAPTIPLRVYLSSEYQRSTAANLLRVIPNVSDPELIEVLTELG